jgi:hypothetical protein
MRHIIWATLVMSLAAIGGGGAGGCAPYKLAHGVQPVPPGNGLIYVYAVDATRRSMNGTVGVDCDGRRIGVTSYDFISGRDQGEYVPIVVAPGPHEIKVSSGVEPLSVDAEAGKSYFVELHNENQLFPKWRPKLADAIKGEYGVNKRIGRLLDAGRPAAK